MSLTPSEKSPQAQPINKEKARIDDALFQDPVPLGDPSNAYGNAKTPEEAEHRSSISTGNNLYSACIAKLLDNLGFILLGDLAAGLFVFTIGLLLSPWFNTALFIWFIALQAFTGLRYFLLLQFRKVEATDRDLESRYQLLVFGSFASGICWGLVPLTLAADSDPTLSALSGLWLAGMLTGAAATLSVMRMVFIAFALPATLAFIASILFHIQNNQFELIASYCLFFCFILPVAWRMHREAFALIEANLSYAAMQREVHAEAVRLSQIEEELSSRRRRENALEAQNARTDAKLIAAAEDRHLLLNALQEGIFGLSDVGAITFINKSALSMLQYREDEVIGLSALQLLSPNSLSSITSVNNNAAIAKTYLEGIPAELIDSGFRNKSNVIVPVRYSAEPVIKNARTIGAVVSFTDLSKQKEMENMLMQSQKMEAIGRLTGGVAHDFNNLLTVILGNLQFLERSLEQDEQSTSLIQKVMAAAQNGAELNNRLLSFSREQSLRTSNVDICALIEDMEDFFSRLLGESIHLECLPCDETCIAATDKTQLENAILNLCINAKDAMPNGGTVTLSARPVDRLTAVRQLGAPMPGQDETFIELSISDNGSGMTDDVKSKIFEPFFTTKRKDRGTGLGLSTVYGFLTQSGGAISVESELDKGTTFRLYLPQRREEFDAQVQDTTPACSLGGRSETLLVVEDNDNVREVAVEMLRREGYRIIEASDGSFGLLQFEAHPEIDMVFSDIVMPGGMNGIDMAEQMLTLRPHIPVLLATGYIEPNLRGRIDRHRFLRCVAKPYDTNALPQLIGDMIDQARRKIDGLND